MDTVRKEAVTSEKLEGRSGANQRYAGADFTGWLTEIINRIPSASVLDLCCGTGNQLMIYGAKPEANSLVGVDLSQESLDTARQRLAESDYSGGLDLVAKDMASAFEDPLIANRHFDLTSCCYGLYYAEDPALVLDRMCRVTANGSLLIVGPYGRNNRSLFDILEQYFPLPALVAESAGPFMTETVQPHLERSATVTIETFVNPVRFPDADAVMRYWRNTTFHKPAHDAAVAADVQAVVDREGGFVIEKHVMALVAKL